MCGTAPPDLPAVYEAEIHHHRRSPIEHSFRHGTLLWLIDADRPPQLPRLARALARFDPSDHIDVRAFLAEHSLTATRTLMLAHARTLGFVFDPATFWWCYNGDRLVATVVEVHNTYGERHAYLVPGDAGSGACVDKALVVSPFHPPGGVYRMRVSAPGDEIRAEVSLRLDGHRPFDARLVARRRPVSRIGFLRLWIRYPWAPLRVAALIRAEAVRLWVRGARVYRR